MEPFKTTVNGGQFQFSIEPDTARKLDLVADGAGCFHILKDGKSHRAELLEADFASKTYRIRVDGTEFSVHIADQFERLIEKLGLKSGASAKQNLVKAPMPGLVLSIVIEVGQVVKKGDPLLILEAMKMENVLKSAGDGIIKSIAVEKGQAVEKGAMLLEME